MHGDNYCRRCLIPFNEGEAGIFLKWEGLSNKAMLLCRECGNIFCIKRDEFESNFLNELNKKFEERMAESNNLVFKNMKVPDEINK